MDLDGVILACATRTEARAARRLSPRTVVVGIRAPRPVPDGPVVSFGLAGGLHDRLECGDVLDATRVIAADGRVLWEGAPLGIVGARPGTILAADRIVDDPDERRSLHARTGADAVDMESGTLALTGRLAGCLRAVSDTPARTLGPVATIVGPNGRVRAAGLARALARPRETMRALRDVRRALRRLEEIAA